MEKRGRKHLILKILGLLMLALVCIGGMELLVCRFAAPELYEKITAPVASLVRQVADQGAQLFQPKPREEEEPEENQAEETMLAAQKAGEPVHQEVPPAEDPAVTEFAIRDGYEVLTGGVVETVYFNQAEEPWASLPYGPDHIAGYGCGPTSMAILISSLCGEVLTPDLAAEEAYRAGYCAPGSGSYFSIVEGMGARYGLSAQSCPDLTAEELCQQLAYGNMFVALMGKGHFTDGGHFIVLRGVTLEGKILVADPNSRERSLAGWDPQLILDELSIVRSNGAPLWRFSTLGTP